MDSVLVCGVDEAGRGPLAGPVYAAAVILDKKRRINGLADSKVLAPERRDVLAGRIKERAIAWAVAHATVEEIDRINIFHASMLAMRRAVQALGVRPEEAWIDGPHSPGLPALRLRPPQGLRHRGAPRRPGPPRTLRDPPAQLLCRRGVFPEGSLRRQLGRHGGAAPGAQLPHVLQREEARRGPGTVARPVPARGAAAEAGPRPRGGVRRGVAARRPDGAGAVSREGGAGLPPAAKAHADAHPIGESRTPAGGSPPVSYVMQPAACYPGDSTRLPFAPAARGLRRRPDRQVPGRQVERPRRLRRHRSESPARSPSRSRPARNESPGQVGKRAQAGIA